MLRAIDGKLELISDYVLENRAPVEERVATKATHLVDTPAGVEKRETAIAVKPDLVLINQNGDKVNDIASVTQDRLDFKTVQAEAQLLCNIEKETTKAGFHKAKAIITSFGIGKIAELDPSKYVDIVNKFREAVKNWK